MKLVKLKEKQQKKDGAKIPNPIDIFLEDEIYLGEDVYMNNKGEIYLENKLDNYEIK